MIEIDKDVPLPAKAGNGRPPEYPFREMVVGDSILVSGRDQARVSSVAGSAAKGMGNGVKFTTRKVDGGVRVWRVS